METEFIKAESEICPRIYIASAILKNFRGHQQVDAHIFRHGASAVEMAALRGKNLVGPPDPAMPAEILAGATEDAALACILEAFTREEAEQLAAYLGARYGEQIEKLTICPLQLPVPLGLGPIGAIPQTAKAGFINFDTARDYALPFAIKAYYDLEQAPGNM